MERICEYLRIRKREGQEVAQQSRVLGLLTYFSYHATILARFCPEGSLRAVLHSAVGGDLLIFLLKQPFPRRCEEINKQNTKKKGKK